MGFIGFNTARRRAIIKDDVFSEINKDLELRKLKQEKMDAFKEVAAYKKKLIMDRVASRGTRQILRDAKEGIEKEKKQKIAMRNEKIRKGINLVKGAITKLNTARIKIKKERLSKEYNQGAQIFEKKETSDRDKVLKAMGLK